MTRHAGLAIALLAAGCAAEPGKAGQPVEARFDGWVETPAGKLRVEDEGRGGVPVLFVHGLGGDRHVWDGELARLAPRRRVVSLDLHGSGDSAPSSSAAFGPGPHAGDILAVMDARGIDRAVIVAHSYGGAVALAFAGAHPERTAGVVFVDSTPDLSGIPEKTRRAFLGRLATPGSYDAFVRAWFDGILRGSSEEVKRQVMGALERTERAVFVASVTELWLWDPEPSLARYHGPRIAIIAAGPNGDTATAYHRLGGFSHQVMTGVSHWLMLDRPEQFAGHLDAFLSTVK
ncbi:MAG TPA: alpha/beta hydrolase [Kofleriaceae bacterium]|nr:alpha/beta hydrolase [Kofleriaceae bacterium]